MDERARAVVIGGGITGASVAYHLARAGWTDVVLVEKGDLTSGSTCHAAGLVTQFNPSQTMMRFRRYSIDLYRELGVFETVGGLRIASSPESLKELERGISRARGIGLDVDLLGPEEALRLLPAASPRDLLGAVWVPGDGHLDPHTATYALAGAARELGVRIRTHVRVTGIELGPRHEVRAVVTDQGRIETEVVVNAAGMWGPQVAAMVGGFIPSTPVDHQHIALHAVPGHELPRDMPCFRDTDNLVYGKSEAGGVLFGGYEADPPARWVDGVPWSHEGRAVMEDEERFAVLMAGAVRRFPFLADAGVVKLVAHPDAMTPDGNPLLGPLPGVRGFFCACGLSLNGFGGAGGIGRAIAEWVTAGETELDMTAYRAWRFGGPYRDPRFAADGAREAYRYYYRQRFPGDHDQLGRPRRLSPLHGRAQDLGAAFQAKNGWERADRYHPGEPWRRLGEEQRGFGWSVPPYLERLRREHAAIRERVGILDMTSFGKLELHGPDALALLERACANRIDRAPGSVIYTQMLDRRGGIVADVTITRLADDRFRVVTGAGVVDADAGWLRMVADAAGLERVAIVDRTDELAVIGSWGPAARDVLAAASSTDVSDAALPFYRAREVAIGPATVLAQRITYVGELGYELYARREDAVQVWDRLWAAGLQHGIEPVGYRALDGLRMEKGYRYVGTDLTPGDTPLHAGLGGCVDWEREGFLGREALLRVREAGVATRLRTLRIGDGGWLAVHGGEAVRLDGAVVSRLRSAAYGFSAGCVVAYAALPVDVAEGAPVEVDVLGERVPGVVAPDVLHDPANLRLRG